MLGKRVENIEKRVKSVRKRRVKKCVKIELDDKME